MPSRSATAFIGRREQLSTLLAAVDDAEAGQARVVLVEGEAGAGKTRLLRRWLESARERGAAPAMATCVDLRGGLLPYGPVTALLRALARELGPDMLRDLARDAPAELAALLPVGCRPGPPPPGTPVDPADGTAAAAGGTGTTPLAAPNPAPRGRLVEGLLDLLDRASAHRPLALCVDDLQWVDDDSADAIRFVARSASTERIVLVLAHRSEEVHRLNALRDDLLRVEGAELLTVPSFTESEVAEHLAGLLQTVPAPDEVHALWARTAGNPYFVEELIRGADWRSGKAPATVQGLLAERVGRLSEPAQRLLRLMAVIGRPSDYPELAGTGMFDPVELDGALSEARAAHLVDVDGSWRRFRFRHPLVGEVLAAGCPPHTRRSAHLAIARALETRAARSGIPAQGGAFVEGGAIAEGGPFAESGAFADGGAFAEGRPVAGPAGRNDDMVIGEEGIDAAELARHWDGAGVDGAALRAHVRAAADATRVAGHAQAWQHWQRALRLWRRVADAPALTGLNEATLRYRAAESARWAGAPLAAVDILRPVPEDASVLDLLARCLRDGGRGREATAAAERAAELLTAAADSPTRARAWAGLAAARLVRSRYRDAIEAAAEAVRIADATGALAVSGHAANTLGVSLVMSGDTAGGLAALERASRIAEECGDLEDRLRAANNLSYAYMNCGRYRESADVARAGFALARRHGVAVTGGALLLTNAATALVWLGEWTEADALAAEGLSDTAADGLAAALHLARAEVAVATGAHARADEQLRLAEQTAAGLDEPQVAGHLHACRAELALWRADPAAAIHAIHEGLSSVVEGEDDQLALRLAALGLRAAADLAETAPIGRGRPEDTDTAMWRELVDKLSGDLDPVAFPEASADAATARAEIGRLDAAADGAQLWTEAARRWQDLRRPYPHAYCSWRAAQALLLAKQAKPAAEALRTSYETARALRAAPLLAEVEALARARRISLRRPLPERQALPGGLTPREREVLDLLTEGLTNRQIARRLYMSEKTAGVHVSRIMAKLGVPTRGAAAAAARRLPPAYLAGAALSPKESGVVHTRPGPSLPGTLPPT